MVQLGRRAQVETIVQFHKIIIAILRIIRIFILYILSSAMQGGFFIQLLFYEKRRIPFWI